MPVPLSPSSLCDLLSTRLTSASQTDLNGCSVWQRPPPVPGLYIPQQGPSNGGHIGWKKQLPFVKGSCLLFLLGSHKTHFTSSNIQIDTGWTETMRTRVWKEQRRGAWAIQIRHTIMNSAEGCPLASRQPNVTSSTSSLGDYEDEGSAESTSCESAEKHFFLL